MHASEGEDLSPNDYYKNRGGVNNNNSGMNTYNNSQYNNNNKPTMSIDLENENLTYN